MTDASGQRCGPDENGMVVDPMSQRCGNCKWFKRYWPKSVDPTMQGGACQYKVRGILPFAYKKARIPGVEQHYGEDCPTWQAK